MPLARKTHPDSNASWHDLLTSITIDGTTKEIKYPHDIHGSVTAGTPLSWYNGDSFTLTCGNGTQLASAKKGFAKMTEKLGKLAKMSLKFAFNFVCATFKGMSYSGLTTFAAKRSSYTYRCYTSG